MIARIVLPLLLAAAPALAHTFPARRTLGDYVDAAALIVRGTIVEESRLSGAARITAIRVDKVLKGQLASGPILRFAADPDHGVRYAKGERVVVFLDPVTGGEVPYRSPQLFGARYPVTSFDPTGYDALITDLATRTEMSPADLLARLRRHTTSHEPLARQYAEQLLRRARH